MPASTHPSNLQRRIHAGGGRVLEQRKSTGVRIHTTPQVGADGKPAEAPHRRAHGDDLPLELRSSLTNRHMETIDDATGWISTQGLTQVMQVHLGFSSSLSSSSSSSCHSCFSTKLPSSLPSRNEGECLD